MKAAVLALAVLPIVLGATYPLAESWNPLPFSRAAQLTIISGDVFWGKPSNQSLYYTTSKGTTILKVDNTSFVPYNDKRFAPKLLSKSAYGVGTVWVMDAVHMPYGCSVWPAFWTQGPNWPNGGEIDIVEGINQQQGNQIAVHAASGCTATPIGQTTGSLTQANCAGGAGASGCLFKDNNANSFGSAFAAAGGGVYVAELASDGIRVWFMSRSNVPSTLTASSSSIDTSTLGTPVASYSSSSCNIAQLFTPQTLTLTITLCGDWAGNAIQETCPALVSPQTCYTTYVINEPAQKYDNAYFEINYVNIYSSTKSNVTGSSASSAASGTGASRTQTVGTQQSGSAAAQSSRAAGKKRWEGMGVGWVVGVAVAGVAGGVAALF
ncbi:concanavalin A-like lectin/glucanase domain-containing protein [Dioszegia hungarica]|uniref:Concanavalin A-like lectin/glucanase domain-containing protein n=1 Tax=Dioszegia hungarica TaxID=4972 RepID=A0AA38HBR8_9TREE|nr:concanavalin A-like lectin/glucanase domain-containing protein [Dioszegia hungarica]KAI9636099.1 concanavalin A-like lectin/glucanase domain-containing protein [Dioszegia hungarica]